MKHVYMMRHGETVDNQNGIIQGQEDSSLTENGIVSVQNMAQTVQSMVFDAVFCSPLGRARRSLEIVAGEIDLKTTVEYVDDIKELDFGTLTKKSFSEVEDIITHHKQNSDLPYLRGESGDMFKSRVLNFMEERILGSDSKNFFIVTHFGVLETILRHYAKLDYRRTDDSWNAVVQLCFNEKGVKYRWIR